VAAEVQGDRAAGPADFACFVRDLLDGPYRYATKVVSVMDNLNTHGTASLNAALPPAEARRLAERLEFHHAPKHGSWLNVAKVDLSALGKRLTDSTGEATAGINDLHHVRFEANIVENLTISS
jgi:hypothetical protein